MPFLQWVNDNEARRAAKAVPFRLLKEEAVYGDASQAKDNLLVKGDNLDALRALIPFYRGKVKRGRYGYLLMMRKNRILKF